jgi:hypothetical protein
MKRTIGWALLLIAALIAFGLFGLAFILIGMSFGFIGIAWCAIAVIAASVAFSWGLDLIRKQYAQHN